MHSRELTPSKRWGQCDLYKSREHSPLDVLCLRVTRSATVGSGLGHIQPKTNFRTLFSSPRSLSICCSIDCPFPLREDEMSHKDWPSSTMVLSLDFLRGCGSSAIWQMAVWFAQQSTVTWRCLSDTSLHVCVQRVHSNTRVMNILHQDKSLVECHLLTVYW